MKKIINSAERMKEEISVSSALPLQRDLFRGQNKGILKRLNPLKGYKFIDLFAGIGGIRIPFDELGAQCVFSSEWDKYSKITYQANFGEQPHGDITKIQERDIPAFDILLAGFPCQPFSHAGLKKGFEDARGTLFYDICRIVDFHKPSVLFLENVKGFRGHNKGNTFRVVKETLISLGYTVYTQVLNARDFGLPQNRERIYIVAFKNKIVFDFPVPNNATACVGDVLDKVVDKKYTISDRLWQGHQRRKKEHQEKGNGFGYSIFDAKSKYTSTISARYYKDGSEILIRQKNKNPRKVTPKEAARLQGFPDSFVIPVSDVQAYKQFGNSVSVPVIKAIAEEISDALNRDSQNEKQEA
ncbi:MAG TPA: DNA (cytosine-5-)-methyltransferase [Rhodospirillaceae bacterium]|nr:DNA (cytosine-5-)-methyltransferase [Rhodospirillaceae bacterium]